MFVASTSGKADPLSIVYVVVSTLASAGVIYAAFRNSFKRMVGRVVAEEIRAPLEAQDKTVEAAIGQVHHRIDDHMKDEEHRAEARDKVTAQVASDVAKTANDVARILGRLEGQGRP